MIGEIISKIVVWFENHHTIRKVLKQGIIGGTVAFLTILMEAQVEIINSTPDYAFVFVILFAGLNGLLNYIKHNF